MANGKYIKNRNEWRKSYPIGIPRRPPVIITETKLGVDGNTYTSTFDLNNVIRHRDKYELLGDPFDITNLLGEYDEDLIHFNNESYKSFNYNFTFSSNPTVVYSQYIPDSTQPNTENINIYGISRNASGGVVALSAPYSGTIRYRAAYAPSYPSYFTGTLASIAPTAGVFIASVDREVPDNQSFVTASWATLASVSPIPFKSPYDDNSNFDGNVALTTKYATLNSSGEVVEISAPMSSSIYILAVQ
ncbi:hypothetical protein EBU71_11115 [bacterium]|nr:hypothetical protein [Candidatus Elulimicrobium humile]